MSSTTPGAGAATPPPDIDFMRAQQDPRFQRLRRSQRRFIFPMTLVFLVWYLAYALTAMYAPEFMSQRVFGYVNVGIVWGLLQFLSTFVITGCYVVYANRVLDPQAVALREEMESGAFDRGADGAEHEGGRA